jgi:hypothetical protein
MNITPETIAEMASMERNVTPEQALQNLDNVCQAYKGSREEHLILRASIRFLAKLAREHAQMKQQLEELAEAPEEEPEPDPDPEPEVPAEEVESA